MRNAVLAAILLIAAASGAAASGPGEDPMEVREKAVAELKALPAGDAKRQVLEQEAREELLERLDATVGPVVVGGFSRTAKLNRDAFGEDDRAAPLEGLAFPASPEGRDASRLVVTTRKLFLNWRRARADAGGEPLPEMLEDALRSDAFYGFALSGDAAFSRARTFAVEKPAQTEFAFAAFGSWSRDAGAPGHIVAAVIKRGRVLVADVGVAETGAAALKATAQDLVSRMAAN